MALQRPGRSRVFIIWVETQHVKAGLSTQINKTDEPHRVCRRLISISCAAMGLEPTEVLAKLVERATFHNAKNGFCVLRVEAPGHRDLMMLVFITSIRSVRLKFSFVRAGISNGS